MKTLIKYNLFLVSLIFCFTPTQEVKSQDFGADVLILNNVYFISIILDKR